MNRFNVKQILFFCYDCSLNSVWGTYYHVENCWKNLLSSGHVALNALIYKQFDHLLPKVNIVTKPPHLFSVNTFLMHCFILHT